MSLAKLDITNLRNIESASLAPSPRLNFIVGPNGSGKTSLLEAIYILGRARSFRSTQAGQVIRFQQECLTAAGRVRLDDGQQVNLGVRLGRRAREIVLAGQKAQSSAELIRVFPVTIIHPASVALLDGAPKARRQFLDWSAFHLEPGFLERWRAYARALAQRNALLRAGERREVEIWNRELSRYGTIVASARAACLERLRPYFHEAAGHFLGDLSLELRYAAGWDCAKTLEETLREDYALDLRDGFTHSGPHKGDFSLLAGGRAVRHYASRGQMKLLALALLLAQAHLLEESLGSGSCVLIDDPASELDADNRAKLLRYLPPLRGQFFIASTDQGLAEQAEGAVFRVEGGRVALERESASA
jgi:DNA replication and repair protein RecF